VENNIRVTKYNKIDETFKVVGEDTYTVTYLASSNIKFFRIVVNGVLTNHRVCISTKTDSYRDSVLSAIQEYRSGTIKCRSKVKRRLKLDQLKDLLSPQLIHNITNYLIPISQVKSRDEMTKYKLI
jgi:hypothetical protein